MDSGHQKFSTVGLYSISFVVYKSKSFYTDFIFGSLTFDMFIPKHLTCEVDVILCERNACWEDAAHE